MLPMLDPQPTDLDLIGLFSLDAGPLLNYLSSSSWAGNLHCVMRDCCGVLPPALLRGLLMWSAPSRRSCAELWKPRKACWRLRREGKAEARPAGLLAPRPRVTCPEYLKEVDIIRRQSRCKAAGCADIE